MRIGAHMTIAKGLDQAIEDAIGIGANTMQIFTRNPRCGKAKELVQKQLDRAQQLVKEYDFGPWVAHAPYTTNLASSKEDVRQFGTQMLKEDLLRVDQMGGGSLVVHTGSHTGQGWDKASQILIGHLNDVLQHCPPTVIVALETMTGSGSEMGYQLEQLRWIIDHVEDGRQLGVCLDTAHLFGAGYDVRQWDVVWQNIDSILDGKRVNVLHLNDSKFPLGSGKDRHERIGQGEIGMQAYEQIITHQICQKIPVILETPNELSGWQEEIALLRNIEQQFYTNRG